jgi:hypothetical protein
MNKSRCTLQNVKYEQTWKLAKKLQTKICITLVMISSAKNFSLFMVKIVEIIIRIYVGRQNTKKIVWFVFFLLFFFKFFLIEESLTYCKKRGDSNIVRWWVFLVLQARQSRGDDQVEKSKILQWMITAGFLCPKDDIHLEPGLVRQISAYSRESFLMLSDSFPTISKFDCNYFVPRKLNILPKYKLIIFTLQKVTKFFVLACVFKTWKQF